MSAGGSLCVLCSVYKQGMVSSRTLVEAAGTEASFGLWKATPGKQPDLTVRFSKSYNI